MTVKKPMPGEEGYEPYGGKTAEEYYRHTLDQTKQGDRFSHVCEDGHCWQEQPDGGVSPSWDFGGTSAKFEGHDPRTCPEPERIHRQYECPTCGTLNNTGHCHGTGNTSWYRSDCEPPAPACGKPAVQTKVWGTYIDEQAGKTQGWRPIEPMAGEQVTLFGEEPLR